MAFLAKLGLVFSLAISSFLGLFHHEQIATSTSQVVQENSQTSATTTILDSEGNPSGYVVANAKIYMNLSDDPNYPPTLVEDYTGTFVALSFSRLYSDGQKIFDQWGKVVSNDAPDFVQVQIPQSQFLCAKDSQQFYKCSNQSAQIEPIKGSDPASFAILNDASGHVSLYAKDKNLVYWFGEPDGYPVPNVSIIPGADPETFQVFSGQSTYDAQDKNHKYLQGQIVQDNSQASTTNSTTTLKVLDDIFATDGQNIFVLCSAVLENCTQTFALQGIDPATFVLHIQIPNEPYPGEYAADAKHLVNREIPAVVEGEYDVSSLQFLPGNSDYLKDKNSVFYKYHDNYLSKIDGADPATFTVVQNNQKWDAQDKNHFYVNGKILI